MILADESVDKPIVQALRDLGFDVVYIAESAPGIRDEEVLAIATADARVLLTGDKDFGELVFRRRLAHAGVVLFRLPDAGPHGRAAIVAPAFESHLDAFKGAFTVISPRGIRIRPRGPE